MRCAHCVGPLGDSPSTDFCSERCQWLWWWEQSGRTDPELIARARSLDIQVTAMLDRQRSVTVPR